MKGHFAALRVTDLWQNQEAQVCEEVAPDTPEEEIKEKFEMPTIITFPSPKLCRQPPNT